MAGRAQTIMKARLKGAQTGRNLLKKKSDALSMRFRQILRKIIEVCAYYCILLIFLSYQIVQVVIKLSQNFACCLPRPRLRWERWWERQHFLWQRPNLLLGTLGIIFVYMYMYKNIMCVYICIRNFLFLPLDAALLSSRMSIKLKWRSVQRKIMWLVSESFFLYNNSCVCHCFFIYVCLFKRCDPPRFWALPRRRRQ